jgi:glutaconate CoA-transferase subunit B
VTHVHPGVTRDKIQAATGWPIRFAAQVGQTPMPSATELNVLRRVKAETEKAHRANV